MKVFPSSAIIRFAAPLALCLVIGTAAAQPNHITRPIDNRERMTLSGHLHPKALAEFAYTWSDLMNLEIVPVLEDEGLSLVFQSGDKASAKLAGARA